jgi:thiamine-phosphate pyrophosphorylase
MEIVEKLHNIKGLYAITPDERNLSILKSKVESSIKGGATLVQYRSKILSKNDQKKQAEEIKKICDYYKIPLIINDDIELCSILDADGVHLGENDVNLEKARFILGPEKIVGVSCYNSIDRVKISQDKGATYVALGACFQSATKPNAPIASVDLIALVLKNFQVPLVAIGGITLENIDLIINEGVECCAVINNLFKSEDIEGTAKQFSSLLQKGNYD